MALSGAARLASCFLPGVIFLAHFLMESLFLMDRAKSIRPQYLLSSAGERKKNQTPFPFALPSPEFPNHSCQDFSLHQDL